MRGLFLKMPNKIILLIILLAGAIIFFFYPLEALTLSLENGQILHAQRVKPRDNFLLTYLHSVARSEVREVFQIDARYQIILIETQFQGQGTGLPYNLAEGEKLYRRGDWFILTDRQRVLPTIFWRVQSPWQNRFLFQKEEINFSAKIGNGLIKIQVERMTPFSWTINYWSRKLINNFLKVKDNDQRREKSCL